MIAAPRLLGGPYLAPEVMRGDTVYDEVAEEDVTVGSVSLARTPWPCRLKTGRPSLIVTDRLAEAVRIESVQAITYWWGVGIVTAWKWRKALGVGPMTEGTKQVYRDVMSDRLSPAAVALGRERAATEEARKKRSETKRGKPAHPNTKAALKAAASRPKPEGWGKRANAWMMAGKKAD